MSFSDISDSFEYALQQHGSAELLELTDSPYAFGCGYAAYRINDKVLQLIYDGRDTQTSLLLSPKHVAYPQKNYTTIFLGTTQDMFSHLEQLVKEKIYQ